MREPATTPRRTARSRRTVLAMFGTGVVTIAVGAWYLWAKPPFSDEELAGAADSVAAAEAELREWSCRRPAIGGPPLSEPDLRLSDVVDPAGRFAGCIDAAGEQEASDALGGEVVSPDGTHRRWGWDVPPDEGPAPTPPTPPTGLVFMRTEPPPFPPDEVPPAMVVVQERCPDLPAAIDALARTTDRCSPLVLNTPGWSDPGMRWLWLARATSIHARFSARSGDLEGALVLLIQGASVIRDLRTGPVSLVVAMVSVAAEMSIWSTFNSLLQPTPGPTAEARDRLVGLIDRLAIPHPHGLFAGEAVGLPGYLSDPDGLATLVAAEQVRLLPERCPADAEPTGCFQGPPVAPPVVDDDWVDALLEAVGPPSVVRRRELAVSLAFLEHDYRRYYARTLQPLVATRMMRISLALTGPRQEGRCPPDVELPEAQLEVPFGAGPIEIVPYRSQQYEITAPSFVVEPGFERPVFYWICPAVEGAWSTVTD